ncbi:MAG: hypothetical protein ACFFGZ_20020 [Candidatus Thorarchaeota archaeon]
MASSHDHHFRISKGTLGAILLLAASGSTFLLIRSPQVSWTFSTETEGKKISTVSGSFGFIDNPAAPSLADPTKVTPIDVGWRSFKVKWTNFGLPGPVMIISLIMTGALLLLAGGGALTKSERHKHFILSVSLIASLCLLSMTFFLLLGEGNNSQKLGLNFFEKEEKRVHVDDPYVGAGKGYDVVFRTEPGLGAFLLVLTTLNAFLGTYLIWQNNPNSLPSRPSAANKNSESL